ncbi:hypothetical protein [Aeromicrobium sp. Sec7.5]|uniref:hypothetical protein n=1 Tax=Aeromicrobium sp. Sec7.5 TaxID=3121276 RepID=UPI002FE4B525
MADLLDDVLRESHRSLAERLETSSVALRGDAKCGEIRQRTDAFLIEMCRHVSAVCDVILPAVREQVPNGGQRVRAYVEQVKRFERSAARTKGRLYGASRDVQVPWERVWVELGTEFDRMLAVEADLIAEAVAVCSADDNVRLASRLRATRLTGPTRPHPHSPHTGRLAHVVRRIWILADAAWDSAEARTVPGAVRAAKHPPKAAITKV